MANKEDNLIPFTSDQDREQAKINGIKGGKASQKVQKEKRTFKKAIEWLANSDIKITQGSIYDKFLQAGIDISNMDMTQLATIGLMYGALCGNATNYKTLMEGNNEVVDELGTLTPTLKVELVDNSNLEKTLYETNKH
jgi:hypothetical protein